MSERETTLLEFPRPVKGFVFDLDGTLIDSERLVEDAYMAQTRAFGVEFTKAQFLSLVGLHRDANSAKLLEYFGADFPLDDFYDGLTQEIGDGVAPLKPGAEVLLEALDGAGVPYGLATSSGRPWVERHFEAYGFHARFGSAVSRHDVENRKPHPEPYLKAAHGLGVDPVHVVAVEDTPTGLRSAHSAGMMAVLVPDMIAPDADTRALALGVVETLHDVLAAF